jgi:hypothetical protein
MSKAHSGFPATQVKFSAKHRALQNVPTRLRRLALSIAVAGLMTSGCGTQQATLYITAPPTAVAGSPFTVTVTAMIGRSPDRVINSPILFTSSDSAAILPPFYGFTANDAGSHTFVNGATLMTPGTQTITATIKDGSALTATANVTVSAAATPSR